MKKLNLPINKITELYNSGEGCFKIAKKFNCSASYINYYLKQNGINTKKLPDKYRKFSLDENYFSIINTEAKSYFLGLLYADGNIYNHSLRLYLQEEDSYILESFKKELKTECPLYITYPKVSTHKIQKGLAISNKNLIKDLVEKGCIEKKALILKFPGKNIIGEKLIHHFIRGYFDGDGSIYFYKRKINNKEYVEKGCNIASSKDFLETLINFLPVKSKITYRKTQPNSGSLHIGSTHKNLNKLYEFLYKDSNYFLSRKKEKFKKILNIQ